MRRWCCGLGHPCFIAPAVLSGQGAGRENRTLVSRIPSVCSTIELCQQGWKDACRVLLKLRLNQSLSFVGM